MEVLKQIVANFFNLAMSERSCFFLHFDRDSTVSFFFKFSLQILNLIHLLSLTI